MPVCIGDGLGEGDCVRADGSNFHNDKVGLKNWWMTDPDSMAAFTAWCYGVRTEQVKPEMNKIENQIKGEPNALPSPQAP